VDEGAVRWNDHDVRDLTLRTLRDAVSVVPQDPVLFKGTLRENLRYARPDATTDDLDRAACCVCLQSVVDRLAGGWDHELGPFGAGLSGGERQRVALARAVLQDRPVVILDEATSALDAATERRVLENLTPWSARKILIVISHRLGAVRWATRVIVLRNGSIAELRAHHERRERTTPSESLA
jgi:ABC-type multidrug transport system fused ATPase/permease subunit